MDFIKASSFISEYLISKVFDNELYSSLINRTLLRSRMKEKIFTRPR